jgi:hypothetical protein
MPTVPERLGAALVSRLTPAVAGLPGTAGGRVELRKLPQFREDDPDLCVVVSVGAEQYTPATGEADWAWFVTYPVVAVIGSRGGTGSKERPDLRAARAAVIATALNLRGLAAAVPELDDADLLPRPPYTGAAGGKGWETGSVGVNYRTREAR